MGDIRDQIITEEGKDYLLTYVAKINNKTLDASALFTDCELLIQKLVKAYNNKHQTRNVAIYQGYGSSIQSLLNRFSGDYFSPSFLSGYMTNPALLLMQNFFTEQVNDATALGTAFHKIMEIYYNLPADERHRSKLFEILDEVIAPGQDREKLESFVKGYYDIKDYLHPKDILEDAKLKCSTEHRGREKLYVKSIGYTLPCAVSYVADRIDYRDEVGPVILDYKTGNPKPEYVTFDGYLGSMILYKWGMEQELNTEISKGYLITPIGKKKYMELDFSKENEQILADKIDEFYKKFIADSKNRVYTFTEQGYFNTDDAKRFLSVMQDNTLFYAQIPQKIYIGEHSDALLK
jgi:hypothetical protein